MVASATHTLPSLPSWLTERPIAHRGLHDARAPENSLAAFQAARDAGYPIELDVHALSDGTLVVFHDADLARATGVNRGLYEEDATGIRDYRLFGTDERIPSLEDVLALVDGAVPLLIELKYGHGPFALERGVADHLARYAGPVAVQSFDPSAVAFFRMNAPQIVRGQLSGPLEDEGVSCVRRFVSRRLLTLPLTLPHFINFDLRGLPDAWVNAWSHALDLPLLCWTVRSEDDRQKADTLGVNYVFDGIRPSTTAE